MNLKEVDAQMARDLARFDYKHHTPSFLEGVTNHYSKTVDTYKREAYADERMDIIKELRK